MAKGKSKGKVGRSPQRLKNKQWIQDLISMEGGLDSISSHQEDEGEEDDMQTISIRMNITWDSDISWDSDLSIASMISNESSPTRPKDDGEDWEMLSDVSSVQSLLNETRDTADETLEDKVKKNALGSENGVRPGITTPGTMARTEARTSHAKQGKRRRRKKKKKKG